jgi:hypothetical protein
MIIGVLTLQFHLEGCRSLKEKRRRLSGLKDKYGKTPNIAICESACHDSHQQAQWSILAVSTDRKVVESTLAKIADSIRESVDAIISEEWFEFL